MSIRGDEPGKKYGTYALDSRMLTTNDFVTALLRHSVGGMCGAIITSPLDVVKTRLQSDLFQQKVAANQQAAAAASSRSAFASARALAYNFVETGQMLGSIASKEGPRALFKGLGPTLVGAVPARSINFFTYGNGKLIIAEKFNDGKETTLVHLGSAASAGIVTATATNPIWVVKTRLQLESHKAAKTEANSREQAMRSRAALEANRSNATQKRGSSSGSKTQTSHYSTTPRSQPASAARPLSLPSSDQFFRQARSPPRPGTTSFAMLSRIVREEGVKGLYKGMSASYLGVAEGTIQWVLYENLKRLGSGSGDSSNSSNSSSGGGGNKLSGTIGAAGTAKFIASLITYPHEVLRTRLRQGEGHKYTGLIQTMKLVWKEEGAAALYGGLSAHLLRVVPNAAVMFSIYELALRFGSQAQEASGGAADRAETKQDN